MSAVRVGVVCASAADAGMPGEPGHADAYALCERGRVTWLDHGRERGEAAQGHGVLVAVADGFGDSTEDAVTAAAATVRALSKLWKAGSDDDPLDALTDFLEAAHTRMYWKARDRDARMGASLAVAWRVDDELVWAEVGAARVLLHRAGLTRRLASPWPEAESQRFLSGSRGLGDDTAVHLRTGRNAGRLLVRDGDRVVLGTDGLWRALDETALGLVLDHVDEAQAAAVSSMERARSWGARDTVTVVVMDHGRIRTREAREALDDERTEPAVGVAPERTEPSVPDVPPPPTDPRVRHDAPPVRRRKKPREG